MSKKIGIVAVLSLATMAGLAGSLSGQLNVHPQSVLYGKTTTEIAYQVSVYHLFSLREENDTQMLMTPSNRAQSQTLV